MVLPGLTFARSLMILCLEFILLLFSGCFSSVFNVRTVDEFIDAIGPDRTIRLAPGEYVLSEARLRWLQYVRWDEAFDGSTITIQNVRGLKIIGDPACLPRVLTRPRYAFVLRFENCADIHVANLVLGHSPEGYCDCGVVGAYNCNGITMTGCDLFGCGTEGLTLDKVTGFLFENSVIRDCSYGIMTLNRSKDLRFEGCRFAGNRKYHGACIVSCDRVSFIDCDFVENRASEGPLIACAGSSGVSVRRCIFRDNDVASIAEQGVLVMGTCSVSQVCMR